MHTIKDLKKLFAKRNASEIASELYGFTGFRTSKLEDLTETEIEQLYTIYAPKSIQKERNDFADTLIKKEWISKILRLATELKFKKPDSYHKFNNWMLMSSKFKKHLNAHSIEELKQLFQQLKAAQSNQKRSAMKPMTKAWMEKAEQLKNLN